MGIRSWLRKALGGDHNPLQEMVPFLDVKVGRQE